MRRSPQEVRNLKLQVVSLAKSGIPPRQIAKRIGGLKLCYVYQMIREARVAGEAIAPFKRGYGGQEMGGVVARVHVWRDPQWQRLTDAAAARKVAPSELIRTIIETVLDAGMVDAVLDDGVNSYGV